MGLESRTIDGIPTGIGYEIPSETGDGDQTRVVDGAQIGTGTGIQTGTGRRNSDSDMRYE